MQLYGFIRFQDQLGLYHADQEAWALNFAVLAKTRFGKKLEPPRLGEELQVLTQENAEAWMEYFDDCMVDPDEVRQELRGTEDDEKAAFFPRFYIDIAQETFTLVAGAKLPIDYEVCLPDGWRFELLRGLPELSENIDDGMNYWREALEDGAAFTHTDAAKDEDDEEEEKDEFDDGFGEMDPEEGDAADAPARPVKSPLADWLHDDSAAIGLDDDEDEVDAVVGAPPGVKKETFLLDEDDDEDEGGLDEEETADKDEEDEADPKIPLPAVGGKGRTGGKKAPADDRLKSILSAINFDDEDDETEDDESEEEDGDEDSETEDKSPEPRKSASTGKGEKTSAAKSQHSAAKSAPVPRARRNRNDEDEEEEEDEAEKKDPDEEEEDYDLDDLDEEEEEEEDGEDEDTDPFGGGDDDDEESGRGKRGRRKPAPRKSGSRTKAAAAAPAANTPASPQTAPAPSGPAKSDRGKTIAKAGSRKGRAK